MKYTKKQKLFFVFIAFVMFIFNNANGFVYCQSEDGHARLEPITDSCCSPFDFHQTAGNENTVEFLKINECGPCTDTIISIDIVNSDKKTELLNPVISALPAISPHLTGCNYGFKSYLNSGFSASQNPSLPCMRTIILQA